MANAIDETGAQGFQRQSRGRRPVEKAEREFPRAESARDRPARFIANKSPEPVSDYSIGRQFAVPPIAIFEFEIDFSSQSTKVTSNPKGPTHYERLRF